MTWPAHRRVVPVVTVSSVEVAVRLARALAEAGLPVIEVTLRSAAALDAIAAIRAAVPEVLCGVGTLLTSADVDAAVESGAQFLVSPGSTDRLLDAMLATGLPCMPGAATASEALRLLERGVRLAKFFPAESSGGAAALAALAAPLPELQWCATGGITASNVPGYLALPTVVAVGGSWMVPTAALEAQDWAAVTDAAREAALL